MHAVIYGQTANVTSPLLLPQSKAKCIKSQAT